MRAIESQVDIATFSCSQLHGEFRFADVSGNAVLVVGFAVQGPVCGLLEFLEVVGAELGQVVLFRVRPERFDRIQFWGVGREVFHFEIGDSRQVFLHEGGAMRRESIPKQNDRPAEVPPHLPQDSDDDGIIDRIVRPQEVIAADAASLRRNADHPDRRDPPLMLELVPQHRSLSSGRPGPLDGRQHQKACFVPENDHRALPVRFFLMRGQSHCTQCSISASFRSRARCSGLCRVNWRALSSVGM